MVYIPSSPPVIAPVPPGEVRPLWSVMIPAYNCSQYLPETLKSVLLQAQAEDQMQIEVVDDASTDADVEAMVKEIGNGRISYYRQPSNVGSLRNFETCLNRSRGHLVHLLHGDDRVMDSFYLTMGQLLEQHPTAGAAFCRYSHINQAGQTQYEQPEEMGQEGILQDWLLRIGERQRVQYAAMVVRRSVYEDLGGFYGLTYGEDWEMWVRIASKYSVAYTPQLLAEYRKHSSSISSDKFISGQSLKDLLIVMDVIQKYLPASEREQVLQKSKTFYAHYGLHLANQIWHSTHHKKSVQAQIKQSLSMHSDAKLYWKAFKLYIKMKLHTA